jgi:Na+/melibiose symporter-like transporter
LSQTAARKVKLSTRLAFGVGQTAEGINSAAFNIFLFFYFNQVLGLPGTLCGVAVFIALFFDAVSDPVAGQISDNYRSARWGRRHPFMFLAAIPLAITFYLLFSPIRGLGETVLFIWLTVFAVLVRLSLTLYHVPHYALGAELTTDYQQRTTLFSYSTFFAYFGGLSAAMAGYNLFFVETPEYANGLLNARAYPWFALTGAVFMWLTIWLCAYGTIKEIPNLPPVPQKAEAFRFQSVLKEIAGALKNPSLRALFIGYIIFIVTTGMREALIIHLGVYFFELTSAQVSLFLVAYFLGVMTAVMITTRVNRWIDKKPTLIAALIGYLVFSSATPGLRFVGLLPENHTPLLLPSILVLSYFGYACLVMISITVASMLADVVDENELNTYKRQEGIFYSARSFALKTSSGLGHLAAGVAIDAMAFPEKAVPGEVEAEAVRMLGMFWGPLSGLFGLLALVFYLRYRLNRKRHREIMSALEERRKQALK